MNPRTSPRRGVALITALVIMAALTVFLSVVAVQVVAQHNVVRQRQRQLQADWLLRAGVEIAAARLLDSPAPFTDDQADLAPESKLRIVVEKAAQSDRYDVKVEAEVGDKQQRPVLRSTTAHFRRTDVNGVVRVQPVAPLR